MLYDPFLSINYGRIDIYIAGILKKPRDPRELDMQSDCSDSQCSCGGSCTCSSSEGEGTPVPQVIDVHVDPEPHNLNNPLSNNINGRILSSDQLYANHGVYECHNPDSATDSAIDLPRGDSSVSTLSDSTAYCQISPQYSKQTNHTAPSLQTITASTNSSNNTLSAADTLDCITRPNTDRSVVSRPKSESYYYTRAPIYNRANLETRCSSVDSLSECTAMIPVPDMTIPKPDSSYVQEVSPCSLEAELLADEAADSRLECMYSSRPDPGPMRTFRPIETHN